jgi:signal transduction histidine kinase
MEVLALDAIVQDAFKLVEASLARHDIRVRMEFEALPPVAVDRHNVLQILQNLLRNAKDAIKQARQELGHRDGVITIQGRRRDGDRVVLVVEDTGIGIEAAALARLFTYGFTTKRDGHGFGLHLGALAAREMQGTLTAQSRGRGFGATFTLELPLNPKPVSGAMP